MGFPQVPGNTPADVIKLRRIKAIELRVEGKMSMRAIAKELGVSPGTICNDIAAIIAEESEGLGDMVKTAREVEAQKLDKWQAKVMDALDATNDPDDVSKLIGIQVRISERRAKLLGLDAPIKQEIDATIGTAPHTAASARALMNTLFATAAEQSLLEADDAPELTN